MADASPPPAKIPRTKSPSPPIADAATVSLHVPTAAASAAQQFSDEIWEEIMSRCSVFDLFCLRDTGHRFRTMIDLSMLEGAFCDAGLDLCFPSTRQWLPANMRGNLGFMKAICVGPCSVCGAWTALPPAADDLRTRLCGSGGCSSYMFSEHMSRGWTASAPRWDTYATYGSKPNIEFDLPEETECWIPRMLVDTERYLLEQPIDGLWGDAREGDNCRMLLKPLLMAKGELEAVGWAKGDNDGMVRNSKDKEGAKLLESIYRRRNRRYEVTSEIYKHLVEWRVNNEATDRTLRQKNLDIVRKRGPTMNAFVHRVLEAHMRDMSEIHLPAANCLFPLPDQPKGPWHPDFDNPEQEFTHIALPRSFVPFMDQEECAAEAARESSDTVKVVGSSAPAPSLEPAPEPAPALKLVSASVSGEIAIASRSDGNADSGRTPGDNHAPSGSARKKAAGRTKARAKARRTKQANLDPKAWYTCTLCESDTQKFEFHAELDEHIADQHPSASASTVS